MRTIRLSRKLILVVLVLSVAVSGVLAVTLFTQTFPAVPSQPQAIITGSCGSTLKSPNQAVTGFGGTALFFCDSTATGQAFTTTTNCPAPPAACLAVTPTFTLPAPYTALYLVPHTSAATSCNLAALAIPITSGNFVTIGPLAISALAPGSAWDYCGTFNNAPSTGLPTFTISWSQGN